MSEEQKPSKPDGKADPEKVNERIQEILGGKHNTGEEIPLNLDPDVVARLAARDAVNSGAAPSALPDEEEASDSEGEPLDPDRGRESATFAAASPENSGIKAWALQMPMLSDDQTTPSPSDKSTYMKAMLHDIPVEFTISLPVGDLTMKIRSLNNHEQDIIFKALEMDQKDEEIAGPAQYVTRLQYYSAVLQITEFNRAKQNYEEFSPEDDFATTHDAAIHLREATRKYIGANNWPTWQVKLTGLKIFEEKLGRCNRAVIDENFWMPVGTD